MTAGRLPAPQRASDDNQYRQYVFALRSECRRFHAVAGANREGDLVVTLDAIEEFCWTHPDGRRD